MSVSDAYDVVVIGAGAGGMTAAAVAAAEGLSVLLIEKTQFVGGTTAWSGGVVWIPANPMMKQAGISDSLSDAADYLASTVLETENADLRDIFLARGPEALTLQTRKNQALDRRKVSRDRHSAEMVEQPSRTRSELPASSAIPATRTPVSGARKQAMYRDQHIYPTFRKC